MCSLIRLLVLAHPHGRLLFMRGCLYLSITALTQNKIKFFVLCDGRKTYLTKSLYELLNRQIINLITLTNFTCLLQIFVMLIKQIIQQGLNYYNISISLFLLLKCLHWSYVYVSNVLYSSKEGKEGDKTSLITMLVVDFREQKQQGATYFF